MKIRNHRLTEHWAGPSKDAGDDLEAQRFIVLHASGEGDGARTRDYLLLPPREKARRHGLEGRLYHSVHVVVDRDGSLWQIVPFNRKARHIGRSTWRGLNAINRWSIAIQMADYTLLETRADGSYRASGGTARFAPGEVVLAVPDHTHLAMDRGPSGWEPYPAAQLQTLERLIRALLCRYPDIGEVLGRQDLVPGPADNPGPAFPMGRFRALADNRAIGTLEQHPGEPPGELLVTTASATLRDGADGRSEPRPDSPLSRGTRVFRHRSEGHWHFVSVANEPEVRGWVHEAYLRLVV